MKIEFFGVRGSIPSPGPSTVRYGGNTVCVKLKLADGTLLICDAGTGLRDLGKQLIEKPPKGPINMMLTHVHWDHIIGIPFFAPLYRRETHLKLWPLANEAHEASRRGGILFDGVHFPVRGEDVPAKIERVNDPGAVWRIGSAQVRRIAMNHPGGAQGFRIDDDDGKSFCYLTDNELAPPGAITTPMDELAHFADEVDVLVHDAQYLASDMPAKHGWGHSTIDDVLRLAKKAHTKRVVLFHHEPERDDDELDAIAESTTAWLHEHAPGTRGTVASEGLLIKL